jgi:hypothetical protein
MMARKRKAIDRTLADDMLDSVAACAQFTGLTKQRLYYLFERGYLPAFKIGTKWCARKSELAAAVTSRRQVPVIEGANT